MEDEYKGWTITSALSDLGGGNYGVRYTYNLGFISISTVPHSFTDELQKKTIEKFIDNNTDVHEALSLVGDSKEYKGINIRLRYSDEEHDDYGII